MAPTEETMEDVSKEEKEEKEDKGKEEEPDEEMEEGGGGEEEDDEAPKVGGVFSPVHCTIPHSSFFLPSCS